MADRITSAPSPSSETARRAAAPRLISNWLDPQSTRRSSRSRRARPDEVLRKYGVACQHGRDSGVLEGEGAARLCAEPVAVCREETAHAAYRQLVVAAQKTGAKRKCVAIDDGRDVESAMGKAARFHGAPVGDGEPAYLLTMRAAEAAIRRSRNRFVGQEWCGCRPTPVGRTANLTPRPFVAAGVCGRLHKMAGHLPRRLLPDRRAGRCAGCSRGQWRAGRRRMRVVSERRRSRRATLCLPAVDTVAHPQQRRVCRAGTPTIVLAWPLSRSRRRRTDEVIRRAGRARRASRQATNATAALTAPPLCTRSSAAGACGTWGATSQPRGNETARVAARGAAVRGAFGSVLSLCSSVSVTQTSLRERLFAGRRQVITEED